MLTLKARLFSTSARKMADGPCVVVVENSSAAIRAAELRSKLMIKHQPDALKIASAVVLVERSELTIGQKVKINNVSVLNVNNNIKKDARKDKVSVVIGNKNCANNNVDAGDDGKNDCKRKTRKAEKRGANNGSNASNNAASKIQNEEGSGNKKRCNERYDSSESSDRFGC